MTRKRYRHPFLAASLCAVFVASPAIAQQMEQGPVQPHQWPSSIDASPRIEAWPNAIRLSGADRYQTSLAASLTLRGGGEYPFSSPDSSSAGAGNLGSANGWWGIGVCPTSVILVAGDSPADALAATSLSDPTTNATEPYLERTASSDPLFYPIGGFTRVNTDRAPVLVTASARSGATDISVATRVAVTDLRAGGCETARQAIIVGGPSAVPVQVETALLSVGYSEIFRVAGHNRFDTAAKVAWSLGTAAANENVTQCDDPNVGDGAARMGWYANSVIEWRTSATRCEVLGRTVVLTDGVTGADALAAGWWTSYWQVPVLLHDGTDQLPQQTAAALQTLDIDNVIVLGGVSRVSESVVAQAETLASATVWRVGGDDRYETSVEMARRFGGWWPTARGNEFASSMVCIAASSGSGQSARGWPDALGAGSWCGALNGAAANPGAPKRTLYPVTGRYPREAVIPPRPFHDAVPLLLVRAGANSLPTSVAQFLSEAFEPGDVWCSSVRQFEGCATPGFAVVFGGSDVIPDVVVGAVSSAVSGASTGAFLPGDPSLVDPFVTGLTMTPVFEDKQVSLLRFCVDRGTYQGARWIVVGETPSPIVTGLSDVINEGNYHFDRDGITRSPGIGSPSCIKVDATSVDPWIRSVSPTGRASEIQHFSTDLGRRFWLTNPLGRSGPSAHSGADLTLHDGSATSSTTFVTSGTGVQAVMLGSAADIRTATITVTIDRNGEDPAEFEATWSMDTMQGTVNGVAAGSALYSVGVWYLRGRAVTNGGTWTGGSGIGGFSVDIAVNSEGFANDSAIWNIDSFGLS